MPKFLKESSHPWYCILHFLFKMLSLVAYLLLNIFIDNLVLCYIVVVILAVIDFWIVKNLTGR